MTKTPTDKTILVVEDDPSLAEAIKIKLSDSGFTSIGERTVDGAMKHISSDEKIDAIWLDHYLLGQKSGLDLVASVKGENSPHSNIPIFVVSNTAGHDKIMTYMRLGVKKYYIKAEHKLGDIIKDITENLSSEPAHA